MNAKYFKILNSNLVMQGFQYHLGENRCNEVVESNTKTGLYITDGENICSYLSFGDKIAIVTIPYHAKIYKESKQIRTDKVYILEILDLLNLETWKRLIAEGVNIHAEYDYALRWYAKCGRLDLVKFLVDNGADPHAANNLALRFAKEENHKEVVDYLQNK